ncbi:hypothetical protein [Neobacillus terrae]|uniref:hypothetical protein n=1 Tax=Neobacillus terrae TaxID=3034837 RepID=UPI001FB0CD9B|nr:hypothetical protein [Neobacillus terrae]
MTPNDLRAIVQQAGWKIKKDITIDSPDLQDGKWEVDKVKSDIHNELHEIINMPVKLKDLILSEVTMLDSFIETSEIKPLPTYSLIAY